VDSQFEQLRTFSAVIDHGSFDAAARYLRVTPSAVSQRMKALETAVGGVLVERGKPARPTASGQVILRLARQVAELEAEALRDLAAGGGGGEAAFARIPVVINGDSLTTWALPALATMTAHRVCVEVYREDQEYSVALLRQGTVMAAITAEARAVQGCLVRPLGSMRYRPMASPEFARTWLPEGATIDALGRAPMVVFDRKDDLQDRYLRQRAKRPPQPPRNYIPSSADFVTAVRLGLGWGMVADQQYPHDDGSLVLIDPSRAIDVPLYWQQWRLHSTPLRLLAEAVTTAATASLRQSPARER
jgi:LysR family transcriptional regulator, chromosome initiation inhibitor